MKILTYREKLQDPRWKKKRDSILLRDNFTCQICMATDKVLNVHHRYYVKGYEPWEYNDNILVTLCQDCHEEISNVIWNANYIVSSNIDIFRLNETVRLMEIISDAHIHDIILTINILTYVKSLDNKAMYKWLRFFAKKGEKLNV